MARDIYIKKLRKKLLEKSIKNKGGTDYIISIKDFEGIFEVKNGKKKTSN